MLIGLHGVLHLVGLVEDHGGHQDDHRDGEPGAERPAGEERDDDDAEGADAADDDGDLKEREVHVRHEHHGRQGDDERAGRHAGRDEDLTGVTLGHDRSVVDQRDEDEGLQEDVESQTGILRGTGGSVKGQRLGGGRAEPEEDHHSEHTPGTHAGDGAHEGMGDATHEESVERDREGAKRSGHQAVGAAEEGGAVSGRGVSDDEGIGFVHTPSILALSPASQVRPVFK